MFLHPSSPPNVCGNMPTVGILALGLVYLFFPLSTCPLQVCLSSFVEPCVWIHSSHAIWCQQAPSAALILSWNSPKSVSRGTRLRHSRVSHTCSLNLEKFELRKRTVINKVIKLQTVLSVTFKDWKKSGGSNYSQSQERGWKDNIWYIWTNCQK